MQLPLEQHSFELHGSTCTWKFFQIVETIWKNLQMNCVPQKYQNINKKFDMSWIHEIYVDTTLYYHFTTMKHTNTL